MPKGRKGFSPSDDPDMRALTRRLETRSLATRSTPINSASAASSSDPTEMRVAMMPDEPASDRHVTRATVQSSQAVSHKIDGRLKVPQSFDMQVCDFAAAQNEKLVILRRALVNRAKLILASADTLSNVDLRECASRLFENPGEVHWIKYNYLIRSDIIDCCHLLCGDTGKRFPARSYSVCLSAAVTLAMVEFTERL